jgi:hypothetical protein
LSGEGAAAALIEVATKIVKKIPAIRMLDIFFIVIVPPKIWFNQAA